MRKFHVIINTLLLITSPSLLVYPQYEPPIIQQACQEKPFDGFNLTYDEILKLLQNIEVGNVDEYIEGNVDSIRHFIGFLAEQGKLPNNYVANYELSKDIADLLSDEADFYDYAYCDNAYDDYSILPAMLLNAEEDALLFLCKHKHKKDKKKHHSSHHDEHRRKKGLFAKIKYFIKKHRKAIIIGAIIVVAAAIVIVAVTASAGVAAAGAAVGAAAASDPNHGSGNSDPEDSSISPSASGDVPPGTAVGLDEAALKAMFDSQIFSFKENIVQNQFFQSTSHIGQPSLSWEESGRALGSIFAHDTYKHLQNEIPYYPLAERQDVDTKYFLSSNANAVMGHAEIDRTFTTDYSYIYSTPAQNFDLNALSHQVLGETALAFEFYEQALISFEKAIEANPENPILYLERGSANFNSGRFDHAIEDYKQYISQVQPQAVVQQSNEFSFTEFTFGAAKGLPRGAWDSGKGLCVFIADCAQHPIQTSKQMVDAITALVNLVRANEWAVFAEALSPEAYQLVTQWDTLSSEKKGELAGYVVGKHGADILTPGALVKVARKSAKAAQELTTVCKNLQMAQETFALEAAAGIGNSVKITEVIETGQRISFVGEELGLTASEMGELKQAGNLEIVVRNGLENILKDPVLRESYNLLEKAEAYLAPYGKKFMPEVQVRSLIHDAGMPTFPRPTGLPDSFRVRLSDGGAGMLYVHPNHTHTSVRIMPGKPHSPNPCQQKPYVIHMKNGNAIDKYGNVIDKKAPEAHIPLEEFAYRG